MALLGNQIPATGMKTRGTWLVKYTLIFLYHIVINGAYFMALMNVDIAH
jgi:hypothetical protein